MSSPLAPAFEHPREPLVSAALVRGFFGGGALICLGLALAAVLVPGALGETQRNALAWTSAAQTLAFALAGWLARPGRVARPILACSVSGLVATTVCSVFMPPLYSHYAIAFTGFYALLCAVFSRRGATLVVLAAVALGAVGVQFAFGPESDAVSLGLHLIFIVAGLVIGWGISLAHEQSMAVHTEREHRFQGLLSIAADWYWEQDEQLRFTTISESVADGMGIPPSAHLGRTRWEIPELEMSAEGWAAHRADLEARRPFRDLLMRRPDVDGAPRYVRVSGEPIFDAARRFKGYWGVARVVTQAVLAQRELESSLHRYREIFDRSPSPMVVHRQGCIINANAAAASLLGYDSPEAMVDVHLLDHYPAGPQRERLLRRLAALDMLQMGERLPLVEYRMVGRDGRAIDVMGTGHRIDLDGNRATLSTFIDMTARKSAEQSLRHSQTLLERLFDTTPDLVTLAESATGRYLMVNDRYTELLGWSREEAIGHTTVELNIYDQPASRESLRANLREHGQLRDRAMLFRAKSGAMLPLRMSAALLNFDGIEYVVAVCRDVTADEKTRQELEAILKYASVGVAFTRNGRFVQVNPLFETIFGWPQGSLSGQPGSVVWRNEEEYAEIGRVAGPLLSAGQPFEAERLMPKRDGGSFWCRMSARVVDPADPSRGGTIWIGEDVSERRQVQETLATARDAAEAASRAKSAFLANTSHEIRTPLNGLLGLARMAREPELDAATRQRYLDQILDSALGLSAVITDVLDLSKIEAGRLSLEAVPLDLRALLDTLCNGSAGLAQERGLVLRRTLDPSLPAAVLGDPMRVRQIVGNFLNNAIKFTERGEIHLKATRGPGELVHIVVADTGPGIDAATQARLFRPFVQADDSTTRRYGGTGLGLSICRELATLMGGAVGVDSQPRRGSRFWADLPLPAIDASELGSTDPSGFDQPVSGARVLVVEDNAVNLLIVRAMLEGWGIEVSEAGDGQEALDVVAAAAGLGQGFDAVLMDVQMPVMSGHDAARRLRTRPDGAGLPIIALTAAALVSERDAALAAGMDAFLTKPVDPGQLRDTLARLLGGRGRP